MISFTYCKIFLKFLLALIFLNVVVANPITDMNFKKYPVQIQKTGLQSDSNQAQFTETEVGDLETPILHETYLPSTASDLTDDKSEEKMQSDSPSDSPAIDNNPLKKMMQVANKTNLNITSLLTNDTIYQNGNGSRHEDFHRNRERYKNHWLDHLKTEILQKTGRQNDTGSFPPEIAQQIRMSLNGTGSLSFTNKQKSHPVSSDSNDGEYIEKIRSYYPSCDVPRNTDEEAWKDLNTMNLFFTIDYNSGTVNEANTNQQGQDETVNIASATLRLYKIPQDGNSTLLENCAKTENPQLLSEDDRQVRVSVYWYLRSLKKHKAIKRRLVDSRMVPIIDRPANSQYVEFNIRQATKSWVKGRNLGLAVIVEDVDGLVLPTEKYFKGIGCDTVGNVSTPKPIPTVVIDAIRKSGGFKDTPHGFNANTNGYNSFMPIIDICTIELPSSIQNNNSTVVCKYLKQNKPIVFSESKNETKTDNTKSTHRHRHHHGTDVRNKIIAKTRVFTNPQVHSLSSNNTFR